MTCNSYSRTLEDIVAELGCRALVFANRIYAVRSARNNLCVEIYQDRIAPAIYVSGYAAEHPKSSRPRPKKQKGLYLNLLQMPIQTQKPAYTLTNPCLSASPSDLHRVSQHRQKAEVLVVVQVPWVSAHSCWFGQYTSFQNSTTWHEWATNQSINAVAYCSSATGH